MEPIEIKGKLVLECLIEAQIVDIRQKICQASLAIDKLEKLLKESKYEKDNYDYDDFVRSIRHFR